MNNKECKLIQDLLPNYIEKLTSSESNKIIEEHLEECKECKKIYEKMKVDFENNHENNDVEVNYAKKVKANLKVLNFILIVIVVAVLVFVGNIVRKYSIFMKLKKLANDVENYSNYKITIESNDRSLYEYFAKDGKFKTIIDYGQGKKYVLCSLETEQYGYTWNVAIDDDYKEIDIDSSNKLQPMEIHTISAFFDESKNSILKYSIISKVKSEEVDGTDCYSFEYKEDDEVVKCYFEKETGMLKKTQSEGVSETYYYKFNCVSDNDFYKPENIKKVDIMTN